MEGLSERAYAAHSGLSRGAVQKARKTGRLVLFADGSINAAASDERRGATTDPDQQMRSRGGLNAGDGAVSGPGDSTSYLKARTALTVYQAQERQLSIQKKKGVLVDRARRDAGVSPRAPGTRCLGHLAHPRDRTDARPRDAGNSMLSKEFPGGILVLTGANSATGLRSMPARYVFLDEVDAYPASADEEGDPVTLAEARTTILSLPRRVLISLTAQ
jgi:hypothetical protein